MGAAPESAHGGDRPIAGDLMRVILSSDPPRGDVPARQVVPPESTTGTEALLQQFWRPLRVLGRFDWLSRTFDFRARQACGLPWQHSAVAARVRRGRDARRAAAGSSSRDGRCAPDTAGSRSCCGGRVVRSQAIRVEGIWRGRQAEASKGQSLRLRGPAVGRSKRIRDLAPARRIAHGAAARTIRRRQDAPGQCTWSRGTPPVRRFRAIQDGDGAGRR